MNGLETKLLHQEVTFTAALTAIWPGAKPSVLSLDPPPPENEFCCMPPPREPPPHDRMPKLEADSVMLKGLPTFEPSSAAIAVAFSLAAFSAWARAVSRCLRSAEVRNSMPSVLLLRSREINLESG